MKKHKLLTKDLYNKLPKLYATDNVPIEEKNVVVKFFDPYGKYTWYVFEGERTEDDDVRFFGLVDGQEKECGYFTLNELQSIPDPFNRRQHRIERDVSFKNVKVKDI